MTYNLPTALSRFMADQALLTQEALRTKLGPQDAVPKLVPAAPDALTDPANTDTFVSTSTTAKGERVAIDRPTATPATVVEDLITPSTTIGGSLTGALVTLFWTLPASGVTSLIPGGAVLSLVDSTTPNPFVSTVDGAIADVDPTPYNGLI